MSMVGSGFGNLKFQARLPKMADNPLDRCTIVSIYPKEIRVKKPTLQPGRWTIPAAPVNGFSLTVIGSSSWWREIDESQPYLEIPSSSFVMAESIIKDYMNGLPDCNMADRTPGLFFIPGEYNEVTIVTYKSKEGKTFAQLLEEAKVKQNNWFRQLVQTADVLWARSNGNPLTISQDARLAAELLKLDKPWLADQKVMQMSNCPACGAMINANFPVCSNCKAVINKAKAKELSLEFVK